MSAIDTTEIRETIKIAIDGVFPNTAFVSAYGIWKIWTELVAAIDELAGSKPKPSQMFYNYSANGMIVKGSKKGPDGDHKYTKDQTAEFLTRMFVKELTKI